MHDFDVGMAGISWSLAGRNTCPWSDIYPSSVSSNPAAMRSNVLLPEPLSPNNPKISPLESAKLMSLTTH